MASLSKGTTFVNSVTYNASDLNNLVDSATVLPGIITDRGAVTPDTADSVLLYDTSGSALAKCTLQNVIDAFPTDAAAGTKSLRTLGTAATQATAGNDTRLPASVTGLRKSAGAGSTDVAGGPKDLVFAPVNITALTTVDCDAADVFYDGALSANKTYTLSNIRQGMTKLFQIFQNGHTVAFSGTWITFGTANTAGWNLYSISVSPGVGIIVISN